MTMGSATSFRDQTRSSSCELTSGQPPQSFAFFPDLTPVTGSFFSKKSGYLDTREENNISLTLFFPKIITSQSHPHLSLTSKPPKPKYLRENREKSDQGQRTNKRRKNILDNLRPPPCHPPCPTINHNLRPIHEPPGLAKQIHCRVRNLPDPSPPLQRYPLRLLALRHRFS